MTPLGGGEISRLLVERQGEPFSFDKHELPIIQELRSAHFRPWEQLLGFAPDLNRRHVNHIAFRISQPMQGT